MKLFLYKFSILIGIIPIAFILFFVFIDNITINNSISSIKSIIEHRFNLKTKILNSSTIINKCKLSGESHLLLSNVSNNYELIILYTNSTNKNLSNIFEEENLKYSLVQVPNIKIDKNKIFNLKSGYFLNISLIENSPNKLKANLSIYNSTYKNGICAYYINFIENIYDLIISCFSQDINNLFCIYVSEQNPNGYISKLRLIQLSFDLNNLTKKSDIFLRAFNYEINYIQALPISESEAALLVYNKNNEIDLYYIRSLLKKVKKYNKCHNYPKITKKEMNLTEKRKAFKIFDRSHKVYIEGHRGETSKFYENTISSFKQAIQSNLDSIELDVWLTMDNVPIVIHSQSKGTFGKFAKMDEKKEKLKIKNVTINYIKEINKESKGKEIPTLEEVLDLCKDKIFINIEIKDYQYKLAFNIVIDLIKKKNMLNQISISSLRYQYLKLIEKFNKNNKIKIECGYIYYPNVAPNDFSNTRGCSLNVHVGVVDDILVKNAHQNGIPVQVYFKKNDEENDSIYKELFNYGVDVICSNSPIKALKFRDKYYKEKNKRKKL